MCHWRVVVQWCALKTQLVKFTVLWRSLGKMDECIHSVFCVSTIRFQHCSNTPGHTLDQIDAHLCWDLVPHGLHTFPQLMHAARLCLVRRELSLEVMPQMLHRIQIWRLRWP